LYYHHLHEALEGFRWSDLRGFRGFSGLSLRTL
jgi:hypothetical protein